MPVLNKKYFILFSIITLCLAFFIFLPIVQAADPTGYGKAINGLDDTAKKGYGTENLNADVVTSVPVAVGKIIGAGLTFIGVIFLVLMVYGGFLWMTAQGNETQVEKAKNLITAAIIGLIIVFSAYAISVFVITKMGGAALEQGVTPGVEE
jgi:hypothetical protein